MATKEEIKKAILEVAGNPESGVVHELADKWADAILEIDSPKPAPVMADKENRITKIAETR
jgi:hypothetical protein